MTISNDTLAGKINSNIEFINKLTESIKNRSKTLNNDIHLAAASCVLHAIEHGNVTPSHNLIKALDGYGWRLNALRDWFQAYGPISIVEQVNADTGKKEEVFNLNKKVRKELIEALKEDKMKVLNNIGGTPFWSYKPEAKYKGFDFDKELTRLLGKLDNVMGSEDKMKDDKTVVDRQHVINFRKACDEMGIKVASKKAA